MDCEFTKLGWHKCINRKGERKEKGENRFKSVWGRLYIILLRLVV